MIMINDRLVENFNENQIQYRKEQRKNEAKRSKSIRELKLKYVVMAATTVVTFVLCLFLLYPEKT